MAVSCETAITDYTYPDASSTESAGSEKKVSKNMKVQVSEEIAEMLLQGRDASGNVASEAMIQAGFGADTGVESMRTTFMIGGKFESKQRAAGLHRWFDVVFCDNTVETRNSVTLPGVELIHEAPAYKLEEVVNDPDFTKQWHYWNQGGQTYKAGNDIRLKEAWEIYGEYGNNEVIVAVFDSGIDCEHPDLNGNMWVNEAEKNGAEGVDDDGNGYVDDVYGYNFVENKGIMSPDNHGTHVAGTVSAVNNNGIGVAGVAGGRYPTQGVRIMAIQILHEGKSGDFERAAQYAAENGAVIAQNSWGYDGETAKNIYPSDRRAIDYFIDNAGMNADGVQVGPMKGGLVVFASGNDSRDFGWPGQYERALAVASVGPDGKTAYYSNYGDWVDVSAPGGNQRLGNECGVYSTVVGGRYNYMQGTSMACPHVSGLAALVLSHAKGEGYTAQELYDHIVSTADASIYTSNAEYAGMLGSGVIDAVNAFAKFSTIPPAAPMYAMSSVSANTVSFLIDLPADEDDRFAYYYDIYFHSEEITEANKDLARKFRIAIDGLSNIDGFKNAVVKGLDFDTEYHWAVTAVDYAGNESEIASKGTCKTGPNAKPVISVSDDAEIVLGATEEFSCVFTYSDPDGHAVTASFATTAQSGVEYSEISEGVAVVRISAADSEPGTYTFTFTVTDEFGLAEVYERTFVIVDNTAPQLYKEIGVVYVNGIGGSAELPVHSYFKDAEGDELTAKFSVKDNNVVSATFSNKKMVLTGKAVGTTEVTVTVSDPAKAEATAKFTVVVRDASKPYDIYPNPVVDVMNIRAGEEQDATIKVYSATGQNVYESKGKLSMKDIFTADLSGLLPGRYAVVIEPAGGESYTSTIVKL